MDVPEGTGSREETLERYRRLRAISRDHHSEMMKTLPKKSFLTWGKRLGLIKGKKVLVANSFSEVHLINDLAIYSAKKTKTTTVERYQHRGEFPEGSDEEIVLNAMCHSRFAFIKVERRHSVAGLIMSELFRTEKIWLMDEGFEKTAPEGYVFASRLFKPTEFYMTTGAAIPLSGGVIEEIAALFPNMNSDTVTNRHGNSRLIEAVYKTAINSGAMDSMRVD